MKLNPKRAAAYLGVHTDTLRSWRREGRGPKYHHLGRLVFYLKDDLDTWFRARAITPSPVVAGERWIKEV